MSHERCKNGLLRRNTRTRAQEWLGQLWPNWCVVRDRVAMHITQVMAGVHLHVHMHLPVSYLGNGWTDYAEIWCCQRCISLAFYTNQDGIHLHVQTCLPLFLISGTAGRIVTLCWKLVCGYEPTSYPFHASMSGVTYARPHVLTSFPYVRILGAHYAEIWSVVDPLTPCFTLLYTPWVEDILAWAYAISMHILF